MAGKQVTELDALPYFTDTSLLPVHNGAGLKKGLLSQLASYLGTKFSNPNLLTNSDFKINQRGKSTYSSTEAGGTVDRWVGTNVKTVVNSDGTVSVSSLSGTGYYTQHEENISYGKHTYSIYVQAITGTVKAFYKSKDSKDVELGTLNQGLNTFTSVDDGFKSFYLNVAGGSSVTLKYAKVEQGTVATSYIAPNPIEEYPKCQRYFQYIPKLYCVPLMYTRNMINSSDKYFQSTNGNLPTEMRIKPTLKYKAIGQSDGSTFADSASFELDSKSINVVTLSSVVSNFSITVNEITLDAEIY
nr:MAG TPA: tail fiber protein [Caudoviricetes sp.]